MDFEGISLRRKFLTGLEPEYINMMIGKHLKANERVLTKSDNSFCYCLIPVLCSYIVFLMFRFSSSQETWEAK